MQVGPLVSGTGFVVVSQLESYNEVVIRSQSQAKALLLSQDFNHSF